MTDKVFTVDSAEKNKEDEKKTHKLHGTPWGKNTDDNKDREKNNELFFPLYLYF